MLQPLRREDIDIEAAFLTGLSPESRHDRLLGGMIQISRAYVEQLTTVDYTRDMALAAAWRGSTATCCRPTATCSGSAAISASRRRATATIRPSRG